MRHPLFLLFALLLSGIRPLPTLGAEVSGKVYDAETGDPVVGAVLEVNADGSRRAAVTSDAAGTFSLPDLGAGKYELVATCLGFEDFTRELTVQEVQSSIEVALLSNPIELAPIEIVGESPVVNRKRGGAVSRLALEAVSLIRPLGTQELLELVPGINGFADDGFGNSRLSIGIRGLNPRRSSRVLLLEDGVPIQPAVYVYPNAYYNPPSERIEAMEIIKGSSAIRFGPQTMGGVINYITRKPGGSAGLDNQLTVGSNGYYSLFSEWRGGFSERLKSDLQLLYKHGDGFRDNNTFDQVNGTFKAQYRISPKKVLYLKMNGNFEDSNATYTGLTEYTFRTDPRFNPKKDDNFRVLRTALDLIYTNRITPKLVGNTTVYTSYFDRRWWREDDVFIRASALGDEDPEPVAYFQSGDLVRVGGGISNFGILRTFYVGGVAQDYSFEHRFMGAPARAEVGARLHWERFVDDKKIGAAPNARSGIYYTGTPDDPDDPVTILGQSHHYATRALALYGKQRLYRGKLTLIPGLRLEVFEQERVDRLRGAVMADKLSFVVLPGLGANYELGEVNLFGGVHRGFTPPSSGTLKVTNFGQDSGTGGLDLKAEKSWNIEAGARRWGRALSAEATVFMVRVEDLVAAGRGTAFKNLGEAQTRGLELSLAWGPERYAGLLPDFNLSYTYLETEIKSGIVKSATMAGNVDIELAGKELPYAPAHTLTVGVAKQVRSSLRLRADVRFVDEVFTDFENVNQTFNRGDAGPVPCYSIVNASVDYKLEDDWELFVTAKNLLDEIHIGSRLHSNLGQPEANLSSGILVGPRRQINLGLKHSM